MIIPIEPEPPPLQEIKITLDESHWLNDVMHNVTGHTVRTMRHTSPLPPPDDTPHPFQNLDFSRLTRCECSTSCTHHLDIPPSPTLESPSTLNTPVFVDLDTTKTRIEDTINNMTNPEVVKVISKIQINRAQNNIGANTTVTNNKKSIYLYEDIIPIHVSGVKKDDNVLTCTGKGFILWHARTCEDLLVPTYYCKEADGTIISPHSVQQYYTKIYRGFRMYCDCNN